MKKLIIAAILFFTAGLCLSEESKSVYDIKMYKKSEIVICPICSAVNRYKDKENNCKHYSYSYRTYGIVFWKTYSEVEIEYYKNLSEKQGEEIEKLKSDIGKLNRYSESSKKAAEITDKITGLK